MEEEAQKQIRDLEPTTLSFKRHEQKTRIEPCFLLEYRAGIDIGFDDGFTLPPSRLPP